MLGQYKYTYIDLATIFHKYDYFEHLLAYLAEKSFSPVVVESNKSKGLLVFTVENISPKFGEEVIKPWVMEWQKTYRSTRKKQVAIGYGESRMFISFKLTEEERILNV